MLVVSAARHMALLLGMQCAELLDLVLKIADLPVSGNHLLLLRLFAANHPILEIFLQLLVAISVVGTSVLDQPLQFFLRLRLLSWLSRRLRAEEPDPSAFVTHVLDAWLCHTGAPLQ